MTRIPVILCLATLAAAGCSQERSRAISEPAAGTRDYRQMIQQTRERQKSQDSLQQMREAIARFQQDIGRIPTNISELVIRRYILTLPQLPPNQQFAYDPALGIVAVVNTAPPDTLSPVLPPAPELTNRPTLAPQP